MASAGITDISLEIESRLRDIEKVVQDLEAKVAEYNDDLAKERHRLEITREFYRLELERHGIAGSDDVERTLFDVPPRFAQATIRSACRQLLQEQGPMHVSAIHAAVEDGGRKVSKTSITSTLIRSDEFERVVGEPNTFRLKRDTRPGIKH